MNIYACRVLTGTIVCCLLFFLKIPARAVPPEVREQVRKTNVLMITDSNKKEILNLRMNKRPQMADYVVLGIHYLGLESEMVKVLRDWVYSGKGAIVDSNNYQLFFGNDELQTSLPSASTTKSIFLSVVKDCRHPLVFKVKKIMWGSGFDRYRPIKLVDELNITAILKYRDHFGEHGGQFGLGIIAKQHGAGRVVLVSDLRRYFRIDYNGYYSQRPGVGVHDNERFAINLDQWLAGYLVPGVSTIVVKDEKNLVAKIRNIDMINLKNGNVLSGKIETEAFKLRASYATIDFQITEISHMVFDRGSQNKDLVVLKNGDKLSGVVDVPTIRILIMAGKQIDLDKEKIKKVIFREKPIEDQAPQKESSEETE